MILKKKFCTLSLEIFLFFQVKFIHRSPLLVDTCRNSCSFVSNIYNNVVNYNAPDKNKQGR